MFTYLIRRFYSSRPEQKYLRNYLITNFDNSCMLCTKKYPLYVLECCHIQPRRSLAKKYYRDTNNVLLLCKNCHSIFDNGDVGIKYDKIETNDILKDYPDIDLNYIDNFEFTSLENEKYLNYHYINIFKKE